MPETANWYHAHNSLIRRADAKTAVGAVSYITGEPMHDEETGRYCTRKHPGDVLDFGMVVPCIGPVAFSDCKQLEKTWNDSQRSEKHPRAQLAHHWNIALSRDWTPEQQAIVMTAIAREAEQRYGVMVAWAVHAPTDHGDDRNAHGHLVYNLRKITPTGFGKKVRELADVKTYKFETTAFRIMIADQLNAHLEKWGSAERVSHLSYEARGIAQEPTVHLGAKLHQAELAGQTTRVGMHNRGVRHRNQRHKAAVRRIESRPRADLRHPVAIIRKSRYRRLRDDIDNQRRKRRAGRVSDLNPNEAMDMVAEQKRLLDQAEQRTAALTNSLQDGAAALDAQFKVNAEIKEQARIAKESRDLITASEAEEKKVAKPDDRAKTITVGNADLNSALLRYSEAAQVYNPLKPWTTLAQAAATEGHTFARQQDQYRKEEQAEPDPRKRVVIAIARRIEAAEYLAITHDRCSKLSSALNGGHSTEAVKHATWAREMAEKAKELRVDRLAAQQIVSQKEGLIGAKAPDAAAGQIQPTVGAAPKAAEQVPDADQKQAARVSTALAQGMAASRQTEEPNQAVPRTGTAKEKLADRIMYAMGNSNSHVEIEAVPGGFAQVRVFEVDDGQSRGPSDITLRTAKTLDAL